MPANSYTRFSKSMAWRYEPNPVIVGPQFDPTPEGSRKAGKWLAGIWSLLKLNEDKLNEWDALSANERGNALRGIDTSKLAVPIPIWVRGDAKPVNANGEPYAEYAVYDDNGDQPIGDRRYAHVKGAKRGRKHGFKVKQQMSPKPVNRKRGNADAFADDASANSSTGLFDESGASGFLDITGDQMLLQLPGKRIGGLSGFSHSFDAKF
ncbi:hypothetical protein Ddc_15318 [Ditylenchus destructor]|nr:hypothetical protein Ddc_15318 [Ditylenchus destructor]